MAPIEDTDGKLIYCFQLPSTHRFLEGLQSNWRPTATVLLKKSSFDETFNPIEALSISRK